MPRDDARRARRGRRKAFEFSAFSASAAWYVVRAKFRGDWAPLVGMSAAWATSNVAQAAIAFVTSLIVARGLGRDGFGTWTLCLAWAATLTMVCDLGFGVLLTREAARENPEVGRMVRAALVARLGLLLPAAIAFLAAAPWLGGAADAAALRIAPAIAAAGIAYGCLAAVFRAQPRSLVVVLTMETTGALMQCSGAWWMMRHARQPADLLILAAVVQLAQLAAVAVMWQNSARGPHHLMSASRSELMPAVRAAWPFALAGLIANAQVRLAPLMLGVMSTTSAVALFGAAARIGSFIRLLPQSAFAGALPALAVEAREPVGRGFQPRLGGLERAAPQRQALRRRFDNVLRCFAVLSAIGIAVAARPIVGFMYGPQFAGASGVLVWMAVGLVPTIVNGGRKVFLYAAGHEQTAVRWSGVALAIQTIGCIALIPGFGAAGAAAALAIGEAVVWRPVSRAVSAVVSGVSRTDENAGPPKGGHYVRPAEMSSL
jgi:O-antigen/teichoic acid export membrane protein